MSLEYRTMIDYLNSGGSMEAMLEWLFNQASFSMTVISKLEGYSRLRDMMEKNNVG